VLSLAAVLAATAGAVPAGAAEAPTCIELVRSTPGLDADIDGDGYPDAHVSSYRDVTLCAQGDVEIYDSRRILDSQPCSELPGCYRFDVTVGFGASADAGLTLCYSVDWWRACTGPDPGAVPVGAGPYTMCIGLDINGGYPCGNGQILAFD
jgi:hypothetical protein